MKIKTCFECHGLGVQWTEQKLRRHLAKVPRKARQKELRDLQGDRSKCQCKLCKGEGMLIYL